MKNGAFIILVSVDQITSDANKLSCKEPSHVYRAGGYYAVWTLTTDTLFTKTQEQTVVERESKLQSQMCVCT